MSSGGQAAGGVLGAVAGFFIGGPQGALYGAQIGIAIGGYLDPPKGPVQEGPRLSDLTVQTSTYGAVIPRGYGTFTVVGNVFWLENNALKETITKKKSGGKGGGSKTTTKTYSYSATFAVGLLDCTDGTPIAGVRRIWIGGRLWYDAGASDLATVIASNQVASTFTVHTGSTTQAANARMQATLGVANTPAYRGLAYIVFNDLPLAPYSNSLVGAQIKVEVVKAGSVSASFVGPTSTPPIRAIYSEGQVFFRDRIWLIGGRDTINGGVVNPYVPVSADGQNFNEYPTNFPTSDSARFEVFNGDLYCLFKNGTKEVWKTSDGTLWSLVATPALTGATKRAAHASCVFDGKMWIFGGASGIGDEHNDVWNTSDGVSWYQVLAAAPWHVRQQFGAIVYQGKIWIFQGYTASGTATDVWNTSDGITWNYVSTVAPSTTYPNIPRFDYEIVVFKERIWFVGGNLSAGVYSEWAISTTDGITFVRESFSPAIPPNRYSMCIAWGMLFCHGSNSTVMHHYVDPISSNTTSLASIVQAECLKSKLLTAGDLNVTALTQAVKGYRLGNVAAIRAGLEPLQAAWPFDVLQSGYTIKFKVRGSSSVTTVPATDLDARSAGETPGVSITNTREMDSVLPRRVTLSYLDTGREYDDGEQYAERLNTDSVNVRSIDLAIALTSAEAAAMAEVLLYLYWMERYDLSFSLPPTYSALEPGDTITVNAAEATYTLRLTAITYAQDGRLECEAKYASSAVYISTALGESGQSTGIALTLAGGSLTEFLDVPTLNDSLDLAGYPVAMTGYLAGWPGGVVYRSDDGGQTWTDVQAFAPPGAVIGQALNSIGAPSSLLMDKGNLLSVRLYQGTLSSVSELAMFSGANYFAYGAAGRWEIIAAQTCTLQGDGSYVLQDLLRGQKGTEWASGLHAIGDKVIELDSSLAFVVTSANTIGLTKLYRGVTDGRSLDAVSDQSFTYTGVNLECLSPVYLNGNRHPTTNDWTLTWIRRTRVGGAWRDYVDATISEATESYEVEIYSSGAYTTLKRTITGLTSATATYTSAEQVADFGSNQSTLYVKVYQISAVVGRGYPLTTSITR